MLKFLAVVFCVIGVLIAGTYIAEALDMDTQVVLVGRLGCAALNPTYGDIFRKWQFLRYDIIINSQLNTIMSYQNIIIIEPGE